MSYSVLAFKKTCLVLRFGSSGHSVSRDNPNGPSVVLCHAQVVDSGVMDGNGVHVRKRPFVVRVLRNRELFEVHVILRNQQIVAVIRFDPIFSAYRNVLNC